MTDNEAILQQYQSPFVFWALGIVGMYLIFFFRREIKEYFKKFWTKYF